ncbi:filamin-A isoform X1 [Hydra vulgaris]|uniref:filamin-A isoform X1 n=1 Tax=Hydra vulgaris TaxID=6087 RepID=UPI001F5FD212|nr:filamin-A isoform X1 [Hydra vulgaris]
MMETARKFSHTMFCAKCDTKKTFQYLTKSCESFLNEDTFPHLVVAKGYGLSTGLAGQSNIFTLDARQAGCGDFDVVINGESRASIEYIEEEEAFFKIKYQVVSPGDYIIEVKYAEKHIPGSPFAAKILDPNVEESHRRNVEDRVLNQLDLRNRSESNNSNGSDAQASTSDICKGTTNLPIEAQVHTPSGKITFGKIAKKINGEYAINFPREEEGTYKVILINKKTNSILPGSPYEVVVKRKLCSNTLTIANIGEANCFSIFGTKGLDLRNLCVAVVGQAGMKLRVFQNDADSIDILYEVKRAGIYLFHIHDNSRHLPGSPFNVKINKKNIWKENTDDIELITYTVTIWHGCDVKRQTLSTKMVTPTGKIIAHTVTRLGRFLMELKFMPLENGRYTLYIQFSDNIIHTFHIEVTNSRYSKDLFIVSGEGKYTGILNQPNEVYIESIVALKGLFSVEIDGPDKVNIVQNHKDDGKIFITYIAQKSGNYLLSVKYNGFHIGGSPFHIVMLEENFIRKQSLAIKAPPKVSDPLLCRAFGLGLKEACAAVSSTFTVDVVNAGSGTLMAGFEENKFVRNEIVCKYIGDGIYEVQYKIDKPGCYSLSVLWNGNNIPGSPFKVNVKS